MGSDISPTFGNNRNSSALNHEAPTSTSAEPNSSRRSVNRPHLFSRNVNFKKICIVNILGSVGTKSSLPSPVEYFLAYPNEEILEAFTHEAQKRIPGCERKTTVTYSGPDGLFRDAFCNGCAPNSPSVKSHSASELAKPSNRCWYS